MKTIEENGEETRNSMNGIPSNDDLISYMKEERNNTKGFWALVLGIISLVVGPIPFLGWFVLPAMIAAVILGSPSLKNPKKSVKGLIGFILGALMILWKFGFWFILIVSIFLS